MHATQGLGGLTVQHRVDFPFPMFSVLSVQVSSRATPQAQAGLRWAATLAWPLPCLPGTTGQAHTITAGACNSFFSTSKLAYRIANASCFQLLLSICKQDSGILEVGRNIGHQVEQAESTFTPLGLGQFRQHILNAFRSSTKTPESNNANFFVSIRSFSSRSAAVLINRAATVHFVPVGEFR